MADGYSKMKAACKFKSRSVDYSDLSSLPHSLSNPSTRHSDHKTTHPPPLPEEEEEEEEEGVHRGAATATATAAALNRTRSVSSSASGFQSAVKRAMSMRRSSSVAERYCRIHDQFATIASPIDDDDDDGDRTGGSGRIMKKKKNAAGKIVRACKRLFGL